MSLHRLTSVTIGVPDVAPVAAFYREFGLVETATGSAFSTRYGGEQLQLTSTPSRRLVELGIGVEDPDDLGRVQQSLATFGVESRRDGDAVTALEPITGTRVVVRVADRIVQSADPVPASNRPGEPERTNARASGLERPDAVHPRKLGHVVLGSPDQGTTQRFFTDGLGFKVTDEIAGIAGFLRCSTDHHNVLVQGAPATYLHHTSWQVDDIDDIGRAATALIDADPRCHVWGLGRHYLGSNFFWYLRDPAGNFAEYYSDLDVVDDDEQWHPSAIADRRALYAWGPPVPDEFIAPKDLAALGS